MIKQIWISLLLLACLLIGAAQVKASHSVSRWLRYDVNINVQQNSGLSVEEVHEVAMVAGATSFDRVIPTDKIDSISNVQVLEFGPNGQRQYQQAETQAPYTFQVNSSSGEYTIQLYFPPNNAASTRFVLRYFVTGGVQFYETGNRIDWLPFGWSAPAPIANSTITINFPSPVAREQLVQESSGIAAEKFVPDDRRASFRATNIAPGDTLEISVTFPAGIVQGAPPAWQQTGQFAAILRWGSILLALLLLFAGPLAAAGWWYYKARTVSGASGDVPKYLKSPPGDLPPAMAGVLLDGKTRPRHLVATLIDLAAKGAINIYPDRAIGLEDDGQQARDYNLYGVDQGKAAQSHESILYGKIFGYVGGKKRQLSAVRKTVFMSVPELENQINLEIAQSGYFAEEAQAARRQYMAFGGAGVLMSIVLALLLVLIFSSLTYAVALPCLSLAVGAAAFIAAGYALPKTTAKGAEALARWQAFKRFINDMNAKAAERHRSAFDRLLPYAITFGLEQGFMNKFAAVDTPAPQWWSIPEEKLPDMSQAASHEWVGSAVAEQPRPARQRTKSVIRRLGATDGGNDGRLLKQTQPGLLAFLKAANEAFSKAPINEEIDFDSLADDTKQ